jgi:hypothetical protein
MALISKTEEPYGYGHQISWRTSAILTPVWNFSGSFDGSALGAAGVVAAYRSTVPRGAGSGELEVRPE